MVLFFVIYLHLLLQHIISLTRCVARILQINKYLLCGRLYIYYLSLLHKYRLKQTNK
jgi:hypothetical protein